jgi:transcriptional regulator NrdR family protein
MNEKLLNYFKEYAPERLDLFQKKDRVKPKVFYSRCPSCKKEGTLKIIDSYKKNSSRFRERFCRSCKFSFITVAEHPPECPYCSMPNSLRVDHTRNVPDGVRRWFRCIGCKEYLDTFEEFPNLQNRMAGK